MGQGGSRVVYYLLHSSSSISIWMSTGGESIGILTYKSMAVLLHLGKSTASVTLGIEQFKPPWDISSELFPHPALVPLVFSNYIIY